MIAYSLPYSWKFSREEFHGAGQIQPWNTSKVLHRYWTLQKKSVKTTSLILLMRANSWNIDPLKITSYTVIYGVSGKGTADTTATIKIGWTGCPDFRVPNFRILRSLNSHWSLSFTMEHPGSSFTRGFWSRSPDWLRSHGGKLDSNPDSDHLSHYYGLWSRFKSGLGTWCSCKRTLLPSTKLWS